MEMDSIRTLIDSGIDYAVKKAEGAIIRGTYEDTYQIRFSQSAIDIMKQWKSINLEIFIIYKGSQIGVTSRAASNVDDVKRAIDDLISFTSKMPESMFFHGAETRKFNYRNIKKRYDEHFDDFVPKAPEFVNATIEEALNNGAKRVAGALKFGRSMSYFHSSFGAKGDLQATYYDLNVRAFQEELDYSGQGLQCGTTPSKDEEAMKQAGAQAGSLSKDAIGASQGEPGTYDLVLSPTVAANVIGDVIQRANLFMVLIGMSPLGDRIGEQLAPENITVNDDPIFPGGLGSRPFDFEGTASQKVAILDSGILKSFIHNTTTARMMDTESTGHSEIIQAGRGLKLLLPDNTNIVFSAGDHSMEELLEGNRPTIYVTSNWYTRFQNAMTGDFSTIPRDAMFLIKSGKMTPIKNLRISDNTLRILANIEAMGRDLKQVYWWEVYTPTIIPAVRISDCKMTAATL